MYGLCEVLYIIENWDDEFEIEWVFNGRNFLGNNENLL